MLITHSQQCTNISQLFLVTPQRLLGAGMSFYSQFKEGKPEADKKAPFWKNVLTPLGHCAFLWGLAPFQHNECRKNLDSRGSGLGLFSTTRTRTAEETPCSTLKSETVLWCDPLTSNESHQTLQSSTIS